MNKFVGYVYPAMSGKPIDPAGADEWIKNSFDVVCKIYEKRLSEHGGRFLAGDRITIADFKCIQNFIAQSDMNSASPLPRETLDKVNSCIQQYPSTARWVATMK